MAMPAPATKAEGNRDLVARGQAVFNSKEAQCATCHSEGMTDGLYWPTDETNGESPAGAFVDQVELGDTLKGEGYFGYRAKILTGQGDRIAGGAQLSHSGGYPMSQRLNAGLSWPGFAVSAGEPFDSIPETCLGKSRGFDPLPAEFR